MSITYPPPKVRGHIATVFGWLFVGGASLSVAAVVVSASLGDGKSWLDVAITCACGLVAFGTGVALIHRRAWAVVAAALETFAGAIAMFALTVYLVRNPPGPPATDGAGYDIMGAFVWGAGFAAISGVLIRPSVRRTLRTPSAGWYHDPWELARLRWWDGESWCGAVVN